MLYYSRDCQLARWKLGHKVEFKVKFYAKLKRTSWRSFVPLHAAENFKPFGLLRGLLPPALFAAFLEPMSSRYPLSFCDGAFAAGGMSGAAAATYDQEPSNELGGEVGATNVRARQAAPARMHTTIERATARKTEWNLNCVCASGAGSAAKATCDTDQNLVVGVVSDRPKGFPERVGTRTRARNSHLAEKRPHQQKESPESN